MTGLSSQQLAVYIQTKMKEQYMEQTRTLEQLQLHMQQQMLQKQAQLMEQIQRLDSHKISSDESRKQTTDAMSTVTSPAGAATNTPKTNGFVAAPPSAGHQSLPPVALSPSPIISTSNYSHSIAEISHSSLPAAPLSTGAASSADESLASHESWDSAFDHERPVVTGSEQSTPTAGGTSPVGSPTYAAADVGEEEGDDRELVSQSVHLPCDEREPYTSPELTSTAGHQPTANRFVNTAPAKAVSVSHVPQCYPALSRHRLL